MQKGKIKKLVYGRAFGFISTEDGKDVFFHQSGLIGVEFSALSEGQEVEFDIERSPRGPRAVNVHISK